MRPSFVAPPPYALPEIHSPSRASARPTTPTQLLALASLLGRGEHDVEVEVRNDSMWPTLHPGDVARVRTGRAGPRSRGTVIAYVDGAGVVPHRIVRRGFGPFARRHVVTRGDSCVLCDPPLSLDSIVGTVVAHQDHDGAWLPVAGAPRRRGLRGMVRAAAALPVVAMLELHPRLARLTALALIRTGTLVAAIIRRPMHRW